MPRKYEQLVFVYGTLKSGHGNNCVLSDSEFVGRAMTKKSKYRLFNCGFPYLVDHEDGKEVVGEVYKVTSPKVMDDLDILEGVHCNHYIRRKIKVVLYNGSVLKCWTYFAHNSRIQEVSTLPLCPSPLEYYEWS